MTPLDGPQPDGRMGAPKIVKEIAAAMLRSGRPPSENWP